MRGPDPHRRTLNEEYEMPDPNPFDGITDLFTEFGRIRETGTHGREYALEKTASARTPAPGCRRPTSSFKVTGW